MEYLFKPRITSIKVKIYYSDFIFEKVFLLFLRELVKHFSIYIQLPGREIAYGAQSLLTIDHALTGLHCLKIDRASGQEYLGKW